MIICLPCNRLRCALAILSSFNAITFDILHRHKRDWSPWTEVLYN